MLNTNDNLISLNSLNFKVFNNYIVECLDYFSNFSFYIPFNSLKIETFKELQLLLQSEDIFIVNKNNKNIGLFALRKNEEDSSLSLVLLSHPKVCKMSILNLNEIALQTLLQINNETPYNNLYYFCYHSMLLKTYKETFKDFNISKISTTFWCFSANLKKENINATRI